MSAFHDRIFGSARRTAAFIAVMGLVARIGLAIALGINAPPKPGTDQEEYDTYAWNVAQGRGYRGMSADVVDQDHLTAFRVPGTSLVWAGFYVIFGHRYDVIRIAHAAFGAIAIWLVFEIGRKCYSERVGIYSAAAYAIYPPALIYTVDLLSEPLGTLLFLWFILASLRFADTATFRGACAAGIILGFSILTRPNSLFMLPLVAVWGGWQFRRNWQSVLKSTAIPCVAVLTLVPWIIRNYIVFHAFIPLTTFGGSGLLQGNNDFVVNTPSYFGYSVHDTTIPEYQEPLRSAGNEVERDRRARSLAIHWIQSHPEKWWFLVREKTLRAFTPFLQPTSPALYRWGMLLSWGPLLVLFGAAYIPTLVGFLRHGDPGWLLHLAILHYWIVSVIFFALSRYRHPIDGLCIILAVRVIEVLMQFMKRAKHWDVSCNSAHTAGM